MKLTYKILWFDDNAEFFDSLDIEQLERRVSEWGFMPECKLVTTSDDFNSQAPYSDFDLLVVDYNLEGIGEGQDFIRSVRDQKVFTEVIFYSSNSVEELWNEVREKKLEGIFVANRGNVIERILSVGQQSLRKVLDVDNMRGIVMAEVGDLDLAIARVLRSAAPHIGEEQRSEWFDTFYRRSCEHQHGHTERLEAFRGAPSIEGLLDLCDSNKLWQNFNRAKKLIGALGVVSLGNYEQEILGPRNHLAHGVATKMDNGEIVFSHRGKNYSFNETVGIALRQQIIVYKGAFSTIETALSSLATPASTETQADEATPT
ncbi:MULTISPECIES: hypothetical protein [Stenotrophomonas]|uniref:hypothetical protein n=1 Tax=Stenotrophomonas TaxID=40323 RepID=UPI0008727609|nr:MULTISPECIES: hypothetical protein [Stenotrophomonas]OEZ00475.1 hypothetical protein BIY45_11520 [Stenotrophomonas sp. BIIR7]